MLKVRQVSWNGIGQATLKIVPDELIRVKFRRISGETVGMKPRMFAEEFSDRSSFVGSASIPENDHWPPQVSEQLAKELGDLKRFNVFIGMESGIESHPFPLWGDAERRDGGNLFPASCGAENRSVSSDGPGSGNVRHHEKSAFVEENQMGFKPFGVFLYAATRIASNVESPSRPARGLSSPAFGNSNPFPPKTSTSGWDDRLSQTGSLLLSPLGAGSRDRLDTHNSARPSKESVTTSVSGGCPTWKVSRERLSNSRPLNPASDRLPTSGKLNSRNSPFSWTRPAGFSTSSSTGSPADAVLPDAFGSHKVSCLIEYDKLNMFSITYA